jgi:hypothetical protein
MTRATPSCPASHAAPAVRSAHPVTGVAARVGVASAEPEAVALVEDLVALLLEHPASAHERAVLERAARFLVRARRGGGRP